MVLQRVAFVNIKLVELIVARAAKIGKLVWGIEAPTCQFGASFHGWIGI